MIAARMDAVEMSRAPSVEEGTIRTRIARGVVAGTFPTLAGVCVYAFLRARETWFVARALDVPVMGPWLRAARDFTLRHASVLPPPAIDVAPDFFWAFAAGAMLRSFDPGPRSNAFWAVLGVVTVVGYEVLQAWHFAPGTFDARDLVAQIVGYALGWVVARRLFRARDQRGAQPASLWLSV
jgi:hypothetical protein